MMSDSAITPTLLAALFTFALVCSITPGPNNVMLTTSGVNFGFRRTVPQMLGIFTGVVTIMFATALGLGFVFSQFPVVRIVLMGLGIGYTLWLSWKIATAGSLGGGSLAHPMPYWGSVAFQGVNPKMWMTAITATAIYVHPDYALRDAALLAVVFSLVNIPCMLVWTGFGVGLREVLKVPGRIRVFNITMGLLLAASVLSLLRL